MPNVIEIGDRGDYDHRGDAEDGPAASPSPGDQDPPAPLKHISVAARRAALEWVVAIHNGPRPFSSTDLEQVEREAPWIAAQVLLDHLASKLDEDHRFVRRLNLAGAWLVLAALVVAALLGPGPAAAVVLLCSTIVSGAILVVTARRIFVAQLRVRVSAEKMDVLEELTHKSPALREHG